MNAQDSDNTGFTYGKAGVDISYTDTIKREMATYVNSQNPRVLNGLGQFASLYDIRFDDFENPVLVLKSEEPDSKQKLAMKYGYTESSHDMINHLVNDIIIMGAKPPKAISKACKCYTIGEIIKR